MLLCLKDVAYSVKRFAQDYDYGEIIRERDLEKSKIDNFDKQFQKLLPELVMLRAVTEGKSFLLANNMFTLLTKTRQSVQKLFKDAQEKNPPINEVLSVIKSSIALIVNEKAIDEETERLFAEHLDTAIRLIDERKLFVLTAIKESLSEIRDQKTFSVEEMEELLEEAENSTQHYKIKNKDFGNMMQDMHRSLDDDVYVLQKALDLKVEIENPSLQAMPVDVINQVASKLKFTREISIFESGMGMGEHLLAFRDHLPSEHKAWTYGTDENLDACRAAKQNGVDVVAKKGIYKMSHKTFDVVLAFFDQFTFFGKENGFSYHDEEVKFNFLFQRQVPKDYGYVLFNVPYYLISKFQRRITRDLTIEGMYRVDDAMKNVLFVTRYKRSTTNQDMLVRKAMLAYDKLPPISDMPDLFINKGELELPKEFRPYFVDEEDIVQAFAGTETSLTMARKKFKPVEKAIELNSPLVEYKEGHLPAVATIEIVNGIFDTNDIPELKGVIDFPTLYTTKIIQQDVKEEIEEMYRGQLVRVVSEKKRNIIVAKARTLDGEVVELLKTN